MKSVIYFVTVCASLSEVFALNLPGPLVYVVTPKSTKPDSGRSSPFYYHNWMRRMDSPRNATTTTTTTTTSSPDLIFAEFEAENGDNMRKSIRNLLEEERVNVKTASTSQPIYVPDEATETILMGSNLAPTNTAEDTKIRQEASLKDMEDYFADYNKAYNQQALVYMPSTTAINPTTPQPRTTTTEASINVKNIWHIIDTEKYNTGHWDEVPVTKIKEENPKENDNKSNGDSLDENFALPGFGTSHGNGGENESRAIRTEPNMRFPYVNLKTFQMKNQKPSNKKGNNMFMELDNFRDISNPVRGEAQDVRPMRNPIDRYNPAQPYLPDYGTKSKQSNAVAGPTKTVSNLVPPPPPPPPPPAAADFPAPTNYDLFPPYPDQPPAQVPASAPSPSDMPANPPSTRFLPPSDDSSPPDSADDGSPMDTGYRYKPPTFLPTVPPTPTPFNKPFGGYSYKKPDMGYSYNKPMEIKPVYDAPPDVMEKPQYTAYNYGKPGDAPPDDSHPPAPTYGSHGHHHGGYDQDYPELIYDKPGHGGMKGGDSMKGNDMGMMQPPPPLPPGDMQPDMSGSPMDSGFPQDFPGSFKYGHDFDHDHDLYHHHHHQPTTTTTTTTTETPRVNRYSYYYLGKKLYYLPLYFSVYFIVYVGALIIKAVLRHKIVYPNSWRPNDQTAGFFSKRSVESWDMSNDRLHEITGVVTKALATAAEKYISKVKSSSG